MRSTLSIRSIRRAAVVGLAAAGVLGLTGQPASAAQTAAAETTSAQASAAPVIRSYGYYCFGSAVRRCAWFNVDHTNNRIRAYSRITDAAGGRNYSVATTRVRLQAWNGRAWVNIGYVADFDGWHATTDTAGSLLVGCRNGSRYLLRSVAYFQWRGVPNGASWAASRAVWIRC